mgnify:CR=1 FL=1
MQRATRQASARDLLELRRVQMLHDQFLQGPEKNISGKGAPLRFGRFEQRHFTRFKRFITHRRERLGPQPQTHRGAGPQNRLTIRRIKRHDSGHKKIGAE